MAHWFESDWVDWVGEDIMRVVTDCPTTFSDFSAHFVYLVAFPIYAFDIYSYLSLSFMLTSIILSF